MSTDRIPPTPLNLLRTAGSRDDQSPSRLLSDLYRTGQVASRRRALDRLDGRLFAGMMWKFSSGPEIPLANMPNTYPGFWNTASWTAMSTIWASSSSTLISPGIA